MMIPLAGSERPATPADARRSWQPSVLAIDVDGEPISEPEVLVASRRNEPGALGAPAPTANRTRQRQPTPN